MLLARAAFARFTTAALFAGAVVLSPLGSSLDAQQTNIVRTARAAGSFSTLLAALDAANLTETLSGGGPYTVFAPTDEAFKKLPPGTVEALLEPKNIDKLRAILLYHVVPGRVRSATARTLSSATTVEGRDVRVSLSRNGELRINESNVVKTDIGASNGIIHVIDAVLLPPDNSKPERETYTLSTDRNAGSSTATSAARDLIDLAIRRGVPLYNDGQESATAAIYEVAAKGVLALDTQLPSGVRTALERGLREAARTHDDSDRAWTLRRALDDAARALNGRRMMSVDQR
ncbi:MAG: fasciclin domain-containing protein [Gemmatimonadaceae bacterium]|nr:fasciclin domain-containing protein [Gemmatimonadaceae bacterium]